MCTIDVNNPNFICSSSSNCVNIFDICVEMGSKHSVEISGSEIESQINNKILMRFIAKLFVS